MPDIKILGDRILVKPVSIAEITKSGLVIPDVAKEKPMKGEVVGAGPGKKDQLCTVKVGDTVLYGKYSGVEIILEDTAYMIMRECDIFAVL